MMEGGSSSASSPKMHSSDAADGSQSPWSMSSLDPLPETPPLQSSSACSSSWRHPSPSPTSSHYSHSHSSSASVSSSYHYPTPAAGYPYHAPQPTYPNPSGQYRQFMYDGGAASESMPAPPSAPAVVYEADPSLHRTHSSAYISLTPSVYAAPPEDKYMYAPASHPYQHQHQHPSYSAPVTPNMYPYPPQQQHQYPFPQQAAYTGYPSSDVRGTHPHHPQQQQQSMLPSPPQNSPALTPTSTSAAQYASPASTATAASNLRYSARHTLDQRALGAFRVQL